MNTSTLTIVVVRSCKIADCITIHIPLLFNGVVRLFRAVLNCSNCQMYLEGSAVVKANNETAFSFFKKAADKVCRVFSSQFDIISYVSLLEVTLQEQRAF